MNEPGALIELRDVSVTYDGASLPALADSNLLIGEV